jgi:DNA polymerase elongation subunit (family B)
MYLQPCDWIEHDVNFKYVIDVYGRTDEGNITRLRITGFRPYLYLKANDGETSYSIEQDLCDVTEKKLRGISITKEQKLDAMRGFSNLKSVDVWRISCPAMWMFKVVIKALKGHKLGKRRVLTEDIYEANLPPLLRFFHEREIQSASPISFEGEDVELEDGLNVDMCYETEYDCVSPASDITIPLYAGAYDIEVYSDSGQFPVSSNAKDEIIQIGVSFRWSDMLLQSEARYVFVSGPCSASQDPTVTFVSCKNEKELLQKFHNCILEENPDILAGYNTFGFDDAYIADRCEFHKLELNFGRTESNQWNNRQYLKTEKKVFELASGKFAVRYIDMPGRLAIDLYLSMRREQNLDSYKLDNVANVFLRDKVLSIEEHSDFIRIHTKSTRGLFKGNLVRLDVVTNTLNPYKDGEKFPVLEVQPKYIDIQSSKLDLNATEIKKLEWSFAKDDVHAKEMFASHHGTPDDRAFVAKYCIQDCDLVLTLMAKLDTLVNARGMADVCRVPIQYIFLRGQGIKIYSAVVYNASKRNQIIMTQEGIDGDTSYEGAIVLPPKIGMYLDQPIPVLDFNSLYPSNMIAYNLSPDTLLYIKTFDLDGKKVKHEGLETANAEFKVDDVGYDIKNDEGKAIGRQVCGFVQSNDNPQTLGLLPLTLDILLKKRKETRKLMEKTEDDAQKSVLNGLQLAYKVVANSIYGQCGSKTSPIRRLEVAACTTAVGRQKIYDAKKIIETNFAGEVIYGDTDSVFVKFPTKDLQESMDMARKSADMITASGRKAHRIEYEKTFYPFVLFCRKRYVGMMYEDDTIKCKRKSMGIALKRRDNAPIVKDVFGGALDILMEQRDIRKAQKFVQDMLVEILQNKMPLEKFIVSKQLRDDYKNPDQIAHAVLAQRMKDRDEGSAPQLGDRLAYIYVAERKDKKKQGDRIEEVSYVREKGLKPDTEFYIQNQIQNPLAQLFALALEDLEGYVSKVDYKRLLRETIESGEDEEEATLKILKQKEKELEKLMFMGARYLNKHKVGPMDKWLLK